MKKLLLPIVALTMCISIAYSQTIVSVSFRGRATIDDINTIIGIPIAQFNVNYYKVTYNSVDAKGNPDVLSGLLMVPDSAGLVYPTLMYEHGTSACKTCVPSRYEETPDGDEGRAGLVFASVGFVSLLPDYVGMGDGNGFQTYVHYNTTVSASEDMLTAVRSWAADNDIALNDQLFITGYSQGGYAAAAFHKGMQDKHGASFVTAAAYNSGPYSLSGVMRDLILVDSAYQYPAYIPNTMLGFNEYYEAFDDIADVFKPEFVTDIQKYYDGDIYLTELNERIIDTLTQYFGSPVAYHMLNDNILDSIANRPNYIINKLLEQNDVYNWVPESPTRIFYCKGDDQVPYKNSEVAIAEMYLLGADTDDVKAEDLDDGSGMTHADCVQPAFTNTLFFFLGYYSVTVGLDKDVTSSYKVYPNPSTDKVFLDGDIQGASVMLYDLNGRERMANTAYDSFKGIDVSSLENGTYILVVTSQNGTVNFNKVIVGK